MLLRQRLHCTGPGPHRVLRTRFPTVCCSKTDNFGKFQQKSQGGIPFFSVVFYYGFRSWRFGASTTGFYYGFLLRIFYYGFCGRGGGPEDSEEQLLRRARESRWAVTPAADAIFLRSRPFPSKMPLSNTRGVVSVILEKRWQCGASFCNEWRLVGGDNPFLKTGAPGIATGEESVTGWRADGRGTVRVGEAHPFMD